MGTENVDDDFKPMPIGANKVTPWVRESGIMRYPYDPRVSCKGRSQNLPPPLHQRQCQATSSRRVQCMLWAVRGDIMCHFHRRRSPLFRKHLLKGFYTNRAGPLLASKLKQLDETPDAQKYSLEGEMNLARVLCERSMVLFEAACCGDKQATPETQALAISTLRSALTHVSNIVTEATKVRAINNDVLDSHGVAFVIAQVQGILEEMVLPLVGRSTMDAIIDKFKSIKIPDNSKTHVVIA